MFLPPAVLFHLPLLLFLSLHLPAVSLRLPWFLATARLWLVLRPPRPPSILILFVLVLFSGLVILPPLAGDTPPQKQTPNPNFHNSDSLPFASKPFGALTGP